MRTIIRIFMLIAAVLFALVSVIKIIKGCSWKEAAGIVEELYKEIKECCPMACDSDKVT